MSIGIHGTRTPLLTGLVAAAMMTSGLVLSPLVAARAQVMSFVEDFSGDALPETLEESGASPDYSGGSVRFQNDQRRYLRTVASYDTTGFIAEVTLTVNNGAGGGSGIAFFGLGAGEADPYFYTEPRIAPVYYLRMMPDDFWGFAGITSSTTEDVDRIEGAGGAGTHRVRMTWTPATGDFAIDIHRHYDGGDFVPTVHLLANQGEAFGPTNTRIFFGGAGDSVFDDFQVLALAGDPGQAACQGDSVSALALDMGGINLAASAFGFPNVKALQSFIRTTCGG